ncbi:MAG: TonB-system energizer ExbB [Cardiobacteriaceae bacterium]|nr:TonB-system energizer ExbB [Cardiobacteriaceae bacterium]
MFESLDINLLFTVDFWKAHVDAVIFSVLGLMSVIMLWRVIERYVFYKRINVLDYPDIHRLNIALEKNLTTIYTVGANAPYVGLLGTVLGILVTFHDLGTQGGQLNAAAIMVGLALALKATALGIVVAIPAVMFYNGLARTVEVKRACWLSLHSGNHEKV